MPAGDSDPDFKVFWQMYGRVGPRLKAWEVWQDVRAGRKRHKPFGPASPQDIINGLERWVTYWRTPGASRVKWPQGWLNDRRWEDDPPSFLAGRGANGQVLLMSHVRARRAQAAQSGVAAAVVGDIMVSSHVQPSLQPPDGPVQGRLL